MMALARRLDRMGSVDRARPSSLPTSSLTSSPLDYRSSNSRQTARRGQTASAVLGPPAAKERHVSSNVPRMAARHWACLALAVLSCLLAFTTSAHAECAWVLWNNTKPILGQQGPTTWELHTAHETKAGCEKANAPRSDTSLEAAYWRSRYQHAANFKNVEVLPLGFAVVVTFTDGSALQITRVCLPDTVDPRGPKGK